MISKMRVCVETALLGKAKLWPRVWSGFWDGKNIRIQLKERSENFTESADKAQDAVSVSG